MKMLDALFNFGKNYATKLGLIGAFLGALGAILAKFAAAPCTDLACWMEVVVQIGAALAIFGGARKAVTAAESKGV